MKAVLRNEIVRQFSAGMSQRQIARHLELSRHTVARVLADWEAERLGPGPSTGRTRAQRAAGQPTGCL